MKKFLFLIGSFLCVSCMQDPFALDNEPDAPGISFEDLTRASVTLTGSARGHQGDATYGFVVTELVNGVERGEAMIHNAEVQEDGSFSWTTDLRIGATYSAHAFISNGLSRKYSGTLTISTPATSKATVSNVTLADGILSATIRDDGGRNIEEVGFLAGDSPDRKSLLRKEKIPAHTVEGNSFSIPLSYFEAGTSLYFLAYAMDDKEDVGFSPVALEVSVSDQDIIHFEDAHFAEYVLANFDRDRDGKISYGEIKVIEEINVGTDQIASIREIALMPALRRLRCAGSVPGSGKLASLSTSKNEKLTFLDCKNNLLEDMDLSGNPLLDTLACAANHLGGLTISANPMLDFLDCRNNEIPEIVLSRNTGIRHLKVGGNPLSSLDVSPCLALKELECGNNQLEALDIQKNAKLERIECRGNELKTLDISVNRGLNYVDGRENPMDTLFLHATQAPETLLIPDGTVLFYYIGGIAFVENAVSIPVGGEYALKVTLDPEDSVGKNIIWTSSDEHVATVSDNGIITGMQPGTCTITAECYGRKASCEITVTIPVSSVSFDEPEREVYIGEKFTLAATIAPDDALDKTLRWESSDPSVASVSEEGAVSSVGIGTATITATAVSGASASFDCIVVSEAPVFPDEYFRAYVYGNFDTNHDGFISREEAKNVRRINFNLLPTNATWQYSRLLASLEGIEYFESLSYLCSNGTSLTSLDVSHNPELSYLDCSSNHLTSLDVSNNPNLFGLRCSSNQLSDLDISQNLHLQDLSCSSNRLSDLDISQNLHLLTLYCAFNQLTTLDISYNSELINLDCQSNYQLTHLVTSNNPNLSSLNCGHAQLVSLDVSNNPDLAYLDCRNNHLVALDVSNNPNLGSLYCEGNQLSTLDVSNNPHLSTLDCSDSPLVSLDLSNNPDLTTLLCQSNKLTSLDISNNLSLTTLSTVNNRDLLEIWLKEGQVIEYFRYDTWTSLQYK